MCGAKRSHWRETSIDADLTQLLRNPRFHLCFILKMKETKKKSNKLMARLDGHSFNQFIYMLRFVKLPSSMLIIPWLRFILIFYHSSLDVTFFLCVEIVFFILLFRNARSFSYVAQQVRVWSINLFSQELNKIFYHAASCTLMNLVLGALRTAQKQQLRQPYLW